VRLAESRVELCVVMSVVWWWCFAVTTCRVAVEGVAALIMTVKGGRLVVDAGWP